MIKIKSNNLPIYNFTIYAERHCGTNFLAQYIPKLYDSPNIGIPNLQVVWDYGWKHWFGFSDKKILTEGQHTLFIGIVRDPYDWLMAFKRMPHHLRNWNGRMDQNPFKDDLDFFTSEIESYHQGKEIIADHHIQKSRRYHNIFELRETKNRYLFDTMPQISHNYILINYEILNTNIESLIITLNNNFNLIFKQFIPNPTNKKPYHVDTSTRSLINSSLNWDTEKQLGYNKIGV